MEQKTNAFLKTVEDKYQYIARADEVTFALHMVEKSTVARAFAKHPVFADLCLDLLGPDCRLYWDQAVYKKAFCPEGVSLAPRQRLYLCDTARLSYLLGASG